jgi:hypothetical protein
MTVDRRFSSPGSNWHPGMLGWIAMLAASLGAIAGIVYMRSRCEQPYRHDPIVEKGVAAQVTQVLAQPAGGVEMDVQGAAIPREHHAACLRLLREFARDLRGTERSSLYGVTVAPDITLCFRSCDAHKHTEIVVHMEVYDYFSMFNLWIPKLGPEHAVAYHMPATKKDAFRDFLKAIRSKGEKTPEKGAGA